MFLIAVILGGWIGHESGAWLGRRMVPDNGLIMLRGFAIAFYAWVGAGIGVLFTLGLACWPGRHDRKLAGMSKKRVGGEPPSS